MVGIVWQHQIYMQQQLLVATQLLARHVMIPLLALLTMLLFFTHHAPFPAAYTLPAMRAKPHDVNMCSCVSPKGILRTCSAS